MEWTVCQARRSQLVDRLIVATPDEEIALHMEAAGDIEIERTSHEWRNGTERCAEVVRRLKLDGYIVNLQGDEMNLSTEDLDRLITRMGKRDFPGFGTLVTELSSEDLDDIHVVKAIGNVRDIALDFVRNRPESFEFVYRHIGVYGYTTDHLLEAVRWVPSSSEKERQLEQMRWLDNGATICLVKAVSSGHAINIPTDIGRATTSISSLPPC